MSETKMVELVSEERVDGVTTKVWKVTHTKALLSESFYQAKLSRSFFFCPRCSRHLGSSDSFCSGCGSDLRIPGSEGR